MDLSYRLMAYLKNTPPAHGAGLRLGLWQGTGEAATPEAVEANLARLEAVLALASGLGVQLMAFPELYLTGYIVTPELARGLAEPVHGPSLHDCVPSDYGETHPTGTRYLEDLRADL